MTAGERETLARPTTTHALDFFFFGRSGAPMRVVNIALHGLNAMLVMRLALALRSQRAPWK